MGQCLPEARMLWRQKEGGGREGEYLSLMYMLLLTYLGVHTLPKTYNDCTSWQERWPMGRQYHETSILKDQIPGTKS